MSSDLCSLVLDAAKACVEALRAHVAEDLYVPSHMSLPLSVKDQDNGMPSVSTAGLMSGPKDYSSVFADRQNEGFPKVILYDDVPGLRVLIEALMSDASTLRLVVPPALDDATPDDREDSSDSVAWHAAEAMAASIATDCADRYVHLYGLDDDLDEAAITSIVEPVCRWLSDDRLPVELLVPMLLCDVTADVPFDIAPGRRIERMSDDLIRARARKFRFSGVPLGTLADAARYAFILDGFTIGSPTVWGQLWLYDIANYPLRDIESFFSALRTVSGDVPGYSEIIIRPLGWTVGYTADLPPLVSSVFHRRYADGMEQWGWNRTAQRVDEGDLPRVAAVYAALQAADESDTLNVAARRITSGDLRQDRDDSLIDYVIGLEALVGDDTAGEATYKMRNRLTALLGASSEAIDLNDVYEAVRVVYKARSDVVHGRFASSRTITLAGQDYSPSSAARWLLTRSLELLVEHEALRSPRAIDNLIVGRLGLPAGAPEDDH